MRHHYKSFAAATFALLLLAACGSSGLGDILGGSNGNGSANTEIRGTVDSVDSNSGSIYLTNVSGYNSMLSSGGGSTARVYYDNRTTVSYQGQSFRPEDLERGDQVALRVDQSGNRLTAQTIDVTYNARNTGSTYPGSTYPSGSQQMSNVRGTVRYLDASRRTVQVDPGYGSLVTVDFDTNTPVYFNGQTYRTSDLQVGDTIDIRMTNYNGRQMAQDITVVNSVRGGTSSNGTYGNTAMSTVRGTVRYVDTARRTIQLDSTSWINNFDRNRANGGTVVVQYDPNMQIDVQGQMQSLTGLEPGDVIDVQVQSNSGSTLYAQRISLVRDVNNR